MDSILLLEDDPAIGTLVRDGLAARGYAVELYSSITGAKRAMLAALPSLLLLDWNLPDGSGAGFCRWARGQWPSLPILFLTVRDQAPDVLEGFSSGADDYVSKPFHMEILASRVRALLRRAGQEPFKLHHCGSITLDEEAMEVRCNGQPVELSRPEYKLLLLLLQNQGCTLTRRQILDRVWDAEGSFVNDNTLTVTMKRLREKLSRPACIKTVRSFGYRMEDTP